MVEKNDVITKSKETKSSKKAKKPRFIVVREYSGSQSMREAFEQVVENRASSQLDELLENPERKIG